MEHTYKCGFCGTVYNEIHDRMNCEAACHKKQAEEAKAAAEAKKKEEQKLRKEAVDEAFEHLHKLVTAYVKDYGSYEYSDGGEDTNFYWPSRAFHRFW
jgi:uncharacterized FlaG/YvyC family protein